MATITPTVTRSGDFSVITVKYEAMGDADVGAPIKFPEFSDRTVQIEGTFASATVVWEGSNDGTNYRTLTDPQGNAISKMAAAIEAVTEIAGQSRPQTSGGSGTDVDVTVVCRRPTDLRT